MIRCVVKEPEIVQVGTKSESVDLPRVDLAFDHEAVKTQADIRTFPHINQAPGAVLEFLPANAECDGVRTFGTAKFEKSGLKVELLFVDGPRTTYTEGIQSTFELNERAHMLSVVSVKRKHVSFVKIPVHVGLLSPIVVADLLPDFSSLTSESEIPIVRAVSQRDVLDRIPEVLPESPIAQER